MNGNLDLYVTLCICIMFTFIHVLFGLLLEDLCVIRTVILLREKTGHKPSHSWYLLCAESFYSISSSINKYATYYGY